MLPKLRSVDAMHGSYINARFRAKIYKRGQDATFYYIGKTKDQDIHY